jgi:hypothetical protein
LSSYKNLGIEEEVDKGELLDKLIQRCRNTTFSQFWDILGRSTNQHGKTLGVLSYEQDLIDTIESGKRLLCILKPTNAGITEWASATSQKRWYWFCSACHDRQPMLPSTLKKTYKPNTFLQSLETRKTDKKGGIDKETGKDLALFGYDSRGAYLVDERETPPPGC